MPPRPATITRKLLHWYQDEGRHDLPWRKTRNSYRILVSEFMLQQTTVEHVIPFYTKWFKLFPNMDALAKASEQSVLAAWKGLGYYRRARSLKKIADLFHANGIRSLPKDRTELIKLPGIGEYTAGALLSFAHDLPEVALDTNIRRVVTRASGCDDDSCEYFVDKLLTHGSPRDINNALMDLGALVCKARGAKCSLCPLATSCVAKANGGPKDVAKKKASKRNPAKIAVGILRDGKQVLLSPRSGLLVASLDNSNAREALQREARKRHKIEIAVRPAYAHGTFERKPASFHRCSLLYGKITKFSSASVERLSRLSTPERQALKIVNLL